MPTKHLHTLLLAYSIRPVARSVILLFVFLVTLERFSYDLEMKTREQNRNNKRTEIERFDWFIERTDKRVWLLVG